MFILPIPDRGFMDTNKIGNHDLAVLGFYQSANLVSLLLDKLCVDSHSVLLMLAGTKGHDATATCPPFRTDELYLRVESAY